MLALLLAIVTGSLQPCETYAPRLDGTQVTVCAGSVTRVEMAPLFVDAIEGTTARVLCGERASDVPLSSLPHGVREGSWIRGGRIVAAPASNVEARRAALGANDDGGKVVL